MKSVKSENIKLLKEWQRASSYSDDTMTWDGIIGQNAYWSAFPRVVFLLKEMARNDGFHEEIAGLPEYFAGYGPAGSSSVFWTNMSSWKYALDKAVRGQKALAAEADAVMQKPLTGIGYIDVKKTARTEAEGVFSNWQEIEKYVRQDASFIRRQLSLMKPQIVFCCGWEQNGNSMFNMFKLIASDLGVAVQLQDCIYVYQNSLVVIDWWHPAYMGADCKWEALCARLETSEAADAFKNMRWDISIL
jgi:hypothetical protein